MVDQRHRLRGARLVFLVPAGNLVIDFSGREELEDSLRSDAGRGRRAKARSWIVQEMPQYIYFDRFDVLEAPSASLHS
jgi:hypothetical protein